MKNNTAAPKGISVFFIWLIALIAHSAFLFAIYFGLLATPHSDPLRNLLKVDIFIQIVLQMYMTLLVIKKYPNEKQAVIYSIIPMLFSSIAVLSYSFGTLSWIVGKLIQLTIIIKALSTSKSKLIIILFIPLLLLGILIGSWTYFFVKNSTSPQTNSNINKPSLKTYKGEEFSFDYPSSWDTLVLGKGTEKESLLIAPQGIVDSVKQIKGGGFGGGISGIMIRKGDDPTLTSDGIKDVKTSSINLAGKKFTKQEVKYLVDSAYGPAGYKIINVYTQYEVDFLIIELLDTSHDEIFNKILSTFEFTD